jgi:hypothetical protein
MKIRPVEAESFQTDGRTDTTKLIVAFRNFANVPKASNSEGFCKYDRLIPYYYQFTQYISTLLLSTLLQDLYVTQYHSGNRITMTQTGHMASKGNNKNAKMHALFWWRNHL